MDDVDPLDQDLGLDEVTPEALLAITGLAVLTEKPRPITHGQQEEARGLSRRIGREMRRFVGRAEFERGGPLVPKFDYLDLLEQLNVEPPVLQPRLERLISGIDDEALALSYSQTMGAALDYLREVIPRRVRNTMAGEATDLPSRQELSQFRRAWSVTNDPTVVFHDLNRGCLSPDMVSTFARVYPTLYQTTQAKLLESVVRMKTARPTWTPDHRKDHALQVLMQTTTFDPGLLSSLQANFSTPEASAQPAKPMKADASELRTPIQRIEGK